MRRADHRSRVYVRVPARGKRKYTAGYSDPLRRSEFPQMRRSLSLSRSCIFAHSPRATPRHTSALLFVLPLNARGFTVAPTDPPLLPFGTSYSCTAIHRLSLHILADPLKALPAVGKQRPLPTTLPQASHPILLISRVK